MHYYGTISCNFWFWRVKTLKFGGNVKKLILMRHAKAGVLGPGQDDFDRPLDGSGFQEAIGVGAYLLDEGFLPELIHCSSAQRTRSTHEALLEGLGEDVLSGFSMELYLPDTSKILQKIQNTEDHVMSLLVISHNPGIHDLSVLLTSSGGGEDLQHLRGNFPTATTAVLEFDCEAWGDIEKGLGTLKAYRVP
jgi:phosphohistidine phosphatase